LLAGAEKQFTFDFSYNSFVPKEDPEYATQTDVWNDLGVGILNNAFEGYNCSLFAYGQTGSGKSYSMVGYGVDRGIIPIACENIFERTRSNDDPDLTIKVTCSMLYVTLAMLTFTNCTPHVSQCTFISEKFTWRRLETCSTLTPVNSKYETTLRKAFLLKG
jgi:hypothetical protein